MFEWRRRKVHVRLVGCRVGRRFCYDRNPGQQDSPVRVILTGEFDSVFSNRKEMSLAQAWV